MTEYCINTYITTSDEEKVDVVTDLFASWLNTPHDPDFSCRGIEGVQFEGIVVNQIDERGDTFEQFVDYNAFNKFFVMCLNDRGKYELASSRFFDTFRRALRYADGIAPSRNAVVLSAVGGFCQFPECEPYPDFSKEDVR